MSAVSPLSTSDDRATPSIRVASMSDGIPRLPVLDSSLALLGDGYLFGTRRFERVGADAFRTRLMGRPVTVIRGKDAAEIFYGGGRFGRDRAMPTSVQHLLQDEGSVQSLSGAAHNHRKGMFQRALGTPETVASLADLFEEEMLRAADGWDSPVTLHDEMVTVLTRSAMRWVGIDPNTQDVATRGSELIGMIDNAAKLGPPNWIARARRRRTEQWAAELIDAHRRGEAHAGDTAEPGSSILHQIATHRSPDGELLSLEVAAVELINVLRPTVAVARFIVFAAHALHQVPRAAQRVLEDSSMLEPFVQEVRRFYPFFPVIGGTVRTPFEWHGEQFGEGDWVMLDLFGTNRHPDLWEHPTKFDPERFVGWEGDPHTLIPQGADDADTGHRCPGEAATVALMVRATRILSRDIHYRVPPQDLRISLQRMPSLPESGFVLERVRAV